jgi:hypothetical protein
MYPCGYPGSGNIHGKNEKMRLSGFLKQPYPLVLETQCNLRDSLLISTFLFLFLIIFQPFGLSTTEPRIRYYLVTGYTCVCFIMLMINLFIIPRILKNIFREERWTVRRRIIWLTWIVFSIGLGNYLFACFINERLDFFRLGLETFLLFQLVTLLIAFFPIVLFTLLNQNYLLRRHIQSARQISEKLKDSELKNTPSRTEDQRIILVSENCREKVQYSTRDLLFLRSEGNYIALYSREKKRMDGLLRNSLTKIEEQLSPFPAFFRCHRAYIVNLRSVRRATGNAQGFQLILNGCDIKIPVSRKYVKPFKKLIELS